MARYALREFGVYDTVLGRVIRRSDPGWADYRQWLRTNTPDPLPAAIITPPTQAELDAEAELAAQESLRTALRADAAIRALTTRSPAQVDAWIDANVTTLATARDVLKILAKVLALLARKHLPPPDPVAAPPTGPPPSGTP